MAMKTKTVTRHYCEHCRKGMFKRDAMARHEARCYRNPKRICERCNNDPGHAIADGRKAVVAQGLVDCRPMGAECPDCFMAFVIRLNAEAKGGEFIHYEMEQFRRDRADWDADRIQPWPDTGTYTL